MAWVLVLNLLLLPPSFAIRAIESRFGVCFAFLADAVSREVNLDVASELLNIPKDSLAMILGPTESSDPRSTLLRQILIRLDEMRQTCNFRTACQLSPAILLVHETIQNLIAGGGLTYPVDQEQLLVLTSVYARLVSDEHPVPLTVLRSTRTLTGETAEYDTFGNWLVAQMRREGLTQPQLAEALGIHVRSVTNHVAARFPKMKVIEQYAKFFGRTPESVRNAIRARNESSDN